MSVGQGRGGRLYSGAADLGAFSAIPAYSPAMDPELLQRVVDLEVRVSYQERLLADLDAVVHDFARRVENLEQQLSVLRDSVDSLDIGPASETPPHY